MAAEVATDSRGGLATQEVAMADPRRRFSSAWELEPPVPVKGELINID